MKYLVSNLKSNKTLKEIIAYKKVLKDLNCQNKEFILFPTSIYLPFFYDVSYKLGSQNISKYSSGSHTGEILASQLKSLNVSYVLVNHKEAEEKVSVVIEKIKNAFKSEIKVILCFGEDEKENFTIDILKTEIRNIWKSLTLEEQKNIILAYEPKWAIQSKNTIDPEELNLRITNLKQFIEEEYKIKSVAIYGGGINSENFNNLLKLDNLDGFMLGNCANNPEDIVKIYEKFQKTT